MGEGGSREIDHDGHPVRIIAQDETLRRYRGFFSGDDYRPHHLAAADGAPAEAETHRDITIEYEGQAFDMHRTTDGDLHSHDLPTLSFTSVDEAARTVAGLVDQGILHGRPA